MKHPTDRQMDALRAIASSYEETGLYPTYRELAGMIDLASPSSAHTLVKALEKKGCITLSGKHRAMTVTAKGRELLAVGTTRGGVGHVRDF